MSRLSVALTKNSDFTKEQIESFLALLSSYVITSLKEGQEVRIPDLATFSFEDKPERTVRIPRTNDYRLKSPERLPKVKLSTGLKSLIQPDSTSVEPVDADTQEVPFEKGIVGFIPPGQFPVGISQLPIASEVSYFLTNGQTATKSEILAKNDPNLLIWHSSFGTNWKSVSLVF